MPQQFDPKPDGFRVEGLKLRVGSPCYGLLVEGGTSQSIDA